MGVEIVEKPLPAEQKNEIIRAEVAVGLKRTVRRASAEFRNFVRPFRRKPNFPNEVIEENGQLVGIVKLTGRTRARQIFNWLDKGTRPYIIRPRRFPNLTFRTDYQPITTPSGGSGGPGRAVGPFRSVREVRHPGIKARDITGAVKRIADPVLDKELELAYKRGFRKAEK